MTLTTSTIGTVRESANKPKKPQPIGGSRLGRPNRSTAAVKQALIEAFDDLGGVPSLVAWARENPTEFYRLWVRMLPQDIKADDASSLVVNVVRFSELEPA